MIALSDVIAQSEEFWQTEFKTDHPLNKIEESFVILGVPFEIYFEDANAAKAHIHGTDVKKFVRLTSAPKGMWRRYWYRRDVLRLMKEFFKHRKYTHPKISTSFFHDIDMVFSGDLV